ncbi:MAG TPA: DUF72 domain-containing protein [Verrucomicrobiae bacterium]|nr:DUF72 domain-containing protein [Verrucomicrobiae bacterium]
MPTRVPNVRVGCCGFATAQEKYFHTFSCVEIDSSFYHLPKIETAARWRAAAPEGFEFCLKAWQVITHRASSPTYRRTRLDPREHEYCGHFGFNPTIRWAWNETFAVAKELGASLVLFQCPQSFHPKKENIARLRRFFEHAKRGKFHMGWEPRGKWDAELVGSLCRELDLIPVCNPLATQPVAVGKVCYFRLHGTTGPQHRHTAEELERLRKLSEGRQATYCMFNNVAMRDDAQRFRKLLGPLAR